MMNTTNVESNVKGAVFLNMEFDENKVLGATVITTENIKEGELVIGSVGSFVGVIDDNGNGHRIVQEGEKKKVIKMDKTLTAEKQKTVKEKGRRTKKAEIELIEKATGMKLTENNVKNVETERD